MIDVKYFFWVGMFYFLIVPWFVVSEGIYLLRHPRTFNGLAAFVFLVVVGIGFIFARNERTLGLVAVIHVVAIGLYYTIKRRARKMRWSKRGGG